MTNKELISKYVDTGLKIPEYQFNKLSNQDKKTYLRKGILLKNLTSYELEMLPPNDKISYINKLDSDDIEALLIHSNEPEKIVDILNKKGLEFSLPDISYIYSSPSPLNFAKLYGLEKVNNFFERYKKFSGSIVTGNNYNRIKNKNEFAKLLILLNKYFNMYISDLLYFFEEDLTYDTIKFYIDTLDNVRDFMALAISIGKKPDSKEKYEAFESIIKAKNGKFTNEDIAISLNPKVFSDVDFAKKTLLNNGVSKDLINQTIRKYSIKTDLIPENYKIKNILKDI